MITVKNATGITFGTKVMVDGEDICQLLSIQEMSVRFKPDAPVTATIELAMVKCDFVSGETTWQIKHPMSGRLATIRSISFADGETLSFNADGTFTLTPTGDPQRS